MNMKDLLREPLTQFVILGLLLFAYFSTQNEAEGSVPETGRIVVSDAQVQQMANQYRTMWKRPPTTGELQYLIAGHVQEEVLVREALALGLDRGDAAIRSRLRQKMLFLTDSAAQSLQPDDETLQAHLQANPEQFAEPAQLSFQQVYLGENPNEADLNEALGRLVAGETPEGIGARTLLPGVMSNATQTQVERAFGRGFFGAAQDLEPGQWQGPTRSGYGVHLVQVDTFTPSRPAALDRVRDKVLLEWRRVQSKALAEAQMQALSARYDIVVPDADAVQGILTE